MNQSSPRLLSVESPLWKTTLWDFANALYSKPDVEQTALALQDRYDANVNIILWCCWLHKEGIAVDCDALPDILISVDAVSQMTVARLRDVRRSLSEMGCLTRVQAGIVSRHILQAELSLEKILLRRLQDHTLKSGQRKGHARECISLSYYFRFIGITDAAAHSQKLLISTNSMNLSIKR